MYFLILVNKERFSISTACIFHGLTCRPIYRKLWVKTLTPYLGETVARNMPKKLTALIGPFYFLHLKKTEQDKSVSI